MKKKLVLKPFVVPTIYSIIVLALIISVFLSIDIGKKLDITYVDDSIIDKYLPVLKEEEKIKEPYKDETVTIKNNYYQYDDPKDKQINSIIEYNNSYYQNTGINYQSDNTFDIFNILDGEVIDVKEDLLLGKSVVIKHDLDFISTYQCLSDVSVKKGDKLSTDHVIGQSGTCELLKDKSNLHFELSNKGSLVNPYEYFNKNKNEL